VLITSVSGTYNKRIRYLKQTYQVLITNVSGTYNKRIRYL
jgi:hypothetical protein